MSPGASVVIVTYNSAATIADCLLSVATSLGPQDEAVVIDNNSQDATLETIRELDLPSKIRVLPQKANLGFSKGCNLGIEQSDKEYIILLNPDTDVYPDWIQRLTAHFRLYDRTGAVGPLSNATIPNQHISTYFSNYEEYIHDPDHFLRTLVKAYGTRSIPSRLLIGFCIALRRDLVERFGGLDEDIFCGDDDLEIAWRLREKGYFLRVALDVFINHNHHTSFNSISKSEGNKLIQQGSDVLFEKMRSYYQPQKIPHPQDYFGISWWAPSILEQVNEEAVFQRKLTESDYQAQLVEAHKLVKQRDLEKAVEFLEDRLHIQVNNYALWYTLGAIYLTQKKYEEAEFALKNAASLELKGQKAANKLKSLRALKEHSYSLVHAI